MIYSHKYKYIYLAPPKTGTKTMETVLAKFYDGKYWDFEGIVSVRKHKKQKEARWPRHIVHIPQEISHYFIFATIRNPYKHALSEYDNQCLRFDLKPSQKGFFKFIERRNSENFYYRLQRHPEYEPPKTCVNFEINQYLNTETLEEDFNKLPFVKEKIKLPKSNKKKSPRFYYTPKMAEILLQHRQLDFDYFGFEKELPSDLKPCLL